jgi:hypothetical protein
MKGLLRLYSRFILKEKDVLIEQVEAVTYYHLKKCFSESAWDSTEQPYPYIKDLFSEPFEEDVIKILEVYDSLGRKLVINDEEDRNSVFTPQPTVLQVPRPVPGVCLSLKCQTKHPPLSIERLEQELELPESLYGALTAFIAWKIYANINTQEAQGVAQNHQANYERICAEVVEGDLVNSSISTTNIKFNRRGWR